MVRPARTGRASLLDAFTTIPGHDLPADRRLADVESMLVPFDERTTSVPYRLCHLRRTGSGGRPARACTAVMGRLPWRSLVDPAAEAAARRASSTNAGQLPCWRRSRGS